MSFKCNDKSGRHNSLDQTYFEFSINAYLTLLCAAGSNHISAAYKVPLSLCLCITKLHMSRISFFFLPRCVRSEWTAENVFFFPKVKVMLHMDMQFKTKILFGGNHNRSVLFRCWDQCEMFKCCFYCCSPKNITFCNHFLSSMLFQPIWLSCFCKTFENIYKHLHIIGTEDFHM